MKLNLDLVLTAPNGKVLTDFEPDMEEDGITPQHWPNGTPKGHNIPLTLGGILYAAAGLTRQGEKLGADKQRKNSNLAGRLSGKGEVELSLDDLIILKERMTDSYNTIVFGVVMDIIDPPPPAKEPALN